MKVLLCLATVLLTFGSMVEGREVPLKETEWNKLGKLDGKLEAFSVIEMSVRFSFGVYNQHQFSATETTASVSDSRY